MAKLFVTLSREEAEENATPVEPIDAGKAAELADQTSDAEAGVKETEELEDGIQEGLEGLEDLQEAENMAAASAGEAPVDVVTGGPVVAEPVECEGDSETPGVAEPTPTGTEDAVAAPAPEVAAAVATECLRQVKKRLGAQSDGIQISFEGLETNSGITQLSLAREGIGDFAKKVWDGIVAFFRKLMEKIKELWSKFLGLFSKQAEVTKELVDEAAQLEKEEPGLFNTLEFPDEIKEKVAQKLAICITDNTDPLKNIEALKNLIVGRQKAVVDAYRKMAEKLVKMSKNGEPSEEKAKKVGGKEFYNLLLGLSQATGTENIKVEFLPSVAKKYDVKSIFVANPFTGAAYSIGYNHKAGEETKENFKHFKVEKFNFDGFKTNAVIAKFSANIKPLSVDGQKKVLEIQEQVEKKYGPELNKSTSEFSTSLKNAVEAMQSKADKKKEVKSELVEQTMGEVSKQFGDTEGAPKVVKDVFIPLGGSAASWCSWYATYMGAVSYYVQASVTAAKKKKGRKAKNYNDDGTFKESEDKTEESK